MTTTYSSGLASMILAAAVACAATTTAATAQQVSAPAKANAAPKKDAGELQKIVDAGIAALNSGKVDLAVQQFSSALAAGGLPAPLLARALFQRGVAYRKQNKPAQAIADLTSALWLKGGLTDTERKQALEERGAAYVDAGLPDPSTRTAATQPSTGVASTATTGAPPEPTTQSAGTGFFATLFGASPTGGDSKVETASVAKAPAAPSGPAVGGWRSATEVKPARPVEKGTQTAVAATGWSADTMTAKGERVASAAGFRVQIANLRNKSEAQSLADRLITENARDLAGRNPEIIETAMGSVGRVWRIKIGPFADTGESQAFCAKIRNKGHDCMIVRE